MSVVNQILRALPEPSPAPRGGRVLSQTEKQQKCCMPLLRRILSKNVPFVAADFLPETGLADSVTNHIGTTLGAGQNGKGGMNLWKSTKGYLPCQENAVLVARCMSDEMMSEFLQEMDWTPEELAERVSSLPHAASF